MSAPSASASSAPPPFILPVPGRLFFVETLPADGMTPAAVEDLVLLSVEAHAPLPPEQLAYGWFVDLHRKNIFYYAAVREQLRQHATGAYDNAGHVLPDFMLAPQSETGVWLWLATPGTLTAARRTGGAIVPEEMRSWPLPADETKNLRQLAEAEHAARQPQLDGRHAPEILYWHGASPASRGKAIAAEWRTASGKAEIAMLPADAAWHADVRERHRLAKMRRTRAQMRFVKKILLTGIIALLLVAGAGAALYFYKNTADAETARVAEREKDVESITGKNELVRKLDQLIAGQVPFFDALATVNHFRTTEILFSRAAIDGNRQVQISGSAATISQINDFVDKLKSCGAFKTVELPRVTTAGGRTSFELRLVVGSLNVSRAAPPAAESDTPPDGTQPATPATAQ